ATDLQARGFDRDKRSEFLVNVLERDDGDAGARRWQRGACGRSSAGPQQSGTDTDFRKSVSVPDYAAMRSSVRSTASNRKSISALVITRGGAIAMRSRIPRTITPPSRAKPAALTPSVFGAAPASFDTSSIAPMSPSPRTSPVA